MRTVVVAGALSLVVVGCRPTLDDRVSLIAGPRVLAVASTPPEAAPGDDVALSALVVDEDGEMVSPRLAWGLCRAPRAATDNGALPDACVDGDVAVIDGDGTNVDVVVPGDACAVFGPDSTGGARPPDPDVTGGYDLPVRVDGADVVAAFGGVRLACRLGDADVDVARAFAERYVRNRAPAVSVTMPTRVSPGAVVDVDVRWSAGDAEDFVVYDRATQTLVTERESIVASFFATAGTFEVERSGRDADDRTTSTTNRFTAPDRAGRVRVWVVARDSRGGVAWQAIDVDVDVDADVDVGGNE
jgi:hypothetical protein